MTGQSHGSTTSAYGGWAAVDLLVQERRHGVAQSLHDVVAAAAPGIAELTQGPLSSVTGAMLVHTLYDLSVAARAEDPLRADEAVGVWASGIESDALVRCGDIEALFVDSELCRVTDDVNHGSLILTLTPSAVQAPPPVPRTELESAISLVSDAGYADLLRSSIGVVILCSVRGSEMLESYSISSMPDTMWVDYSRESLQIGEVLVHETGHNWLNHALTACGEVLPEQPVWHSPWKQTDRPAHGIIHAAWSFSLLIQYFAAYRGPQAPNERMRRYCAFRTGAELQRLREGHKVVLKAFDFVRNQDLRAVLTEQLERTLAIN